MATVTLPDAPFQFEPLNRTQGLVKVDPEEKASPPSPNAEQQETEPDLTPLDCFRQRSLSKGSRTGSRARSGSNHGSGSPRKRGNTSPWDDRPMKTPSFRSTSKSASAGKDSLRCVLILDWDDTLFPTTWIRDDCGFDWRKSLDAQLEKWSKRGKTIRSLLSRFADRASAMLREASKNHHVIIVTLARRGWVHKSIERFCPSLGKVMEECKPKIIYAQEYVTKRIQSPMGAEEALEFWTEVKASAIRKELFAEGVLWTDIVSFGDSQYERAGTKRVASELMQLAAINGGADAGESIRPRMHAKTLKSLNCPTVEECTAQMALLLCWLPFIADRDGDIDIEIDEADDDVLNQIDQLIRGKVCSCGVTLTNDAMSCHVCKMRRPKGPVATEEPLSWLKLAEMEDGVAATQIPSTDCGRPDSGEEKHDDIGEQLFEMVSSMSSALSAGA